MATGRRKTKRRRRRGGRGKRTVVLFLVLALLAALYYFSIPKTLRRFASRYPQARGFVLQYPLKKHIHQHIDISGSLSEGNIPLFIQWDPRWGYETYGSGCLGITGCGPTCLAMIVSGLTGDSYWDPLHMAQYAEGNGWYVWGEGTSWELMSEGAQGLGLTVFGVEATEQNLWDYLSSSSPMIASVYPGDFTREGHFIVLRGFDEQGNILVNDPNSRDNSSISWSMERLLPQIRMLWCYRN